MPDFALEDHGSIVLLRPLTNDARVWIDEHVAADHMTFAGAVCVEPRCVAAIVQGFEGDGLELARQEAMRA